MEIHLPGTSERDGNIEEISSTHVQLVKKIVFIYTNRHVFLTLIMISKFYVWRFASIFEGLE